VQFITNQLVILSLLLLIDWFNFLLFCHLFNYPIVIYCPNVLMGLFISQIPVSN
jgi:hypothetical protein